MGFDHDWEADCFLHEGTSYIWGGGEGAKPVPPFSHAHKYLIKIPTHHEFSHTYFNFIFGQCSGFKMSVGMWKVLAYGGTLKVSTKGEL